MLRKIWKMSATHYLSAPTSQFKTTCQIKARSLNDGTSEARPKKTSLKFQAMYLPFSIFLIKTVKFKFKLIQINFIICSTPMYVPFKRRHKEFSVTSLVQDQLLRCHVLSMPMLCIHCKNGYP